MQTDGASRALIELAASRHNAFTTSEAAELGIKQPRLRQAELRNEMFRIYPSVWAYCGLPADSRHRLHAATLALPGSAASRLSAAWLHGLRDQPPLRSQLWVGHKSTARLSNSDVHRFTRIDPGLDLTWVGGTRVLSKAATLCLMGAKCSLDSLEFALDEFLRTESEGWLEQTMARLYTAKAAGPFALKQVIENPKRAPGLAESQMERITSRLLAIDGLPPLVLQHEVEADGRKFRFDVACPELMIGVEYHSRAFHWGRGKADADNTRDLLIGSLGWKVIYVTHLQLNDPDELVRLFGLTARHQAKLLGLTWQAS